jgi:signal peptide peptidase SppA
MSTHPHSLDRVLSLAVEYPWAITPTMLPIVARVLGQRLASETPLDLSAFTGSRPTPATTAPGGVALIPLHGVIAPRMNLLSDISGGTTFEAASTALAQAVANPNVSTIVLDIDSPGGSVTGATEFAQRLRQARAIKPIVAVANFQMCSAAYWVGSCATEVVASPSSQLGSIGVYTIHEDLSAALEQLGVKLTYISAGKFKVEGMSGQPLTDSAKARVQAQVDDAFNRFVGDVAAGRRTTAAAIRGGYGQGAVVSAEEAQTLGMIDRLATLEETIARVLPTSRATSSPAFAAIADARRRFPLAARR